MQMPGPMWLAFIGTNNYDGGKLAGEWTAANVNGQVMRMITGTLGNQCHTDRTNGYLDGLKGAPILSW